MRMEALAYASIDQLTLDSLRLESCVVKAMHKDILKLQTNGC